MTKKELIIAVAEYPDDSEVLIFSPSYDVKLRIKKIEYNEYPDGIKTIYIIEEE